MKYSSVVFHNSLSQSQLKLDTHVTAIQTQLDALTLGFASGSQVFGPNQKRHV